MTAYDFTLILGSETELTNYSADNLFRVLMGDQVEPRREFIQKHALDVRNLDVYEVDPKNWTA
jgi:DNA gyrase/topoisomerase IV subunit B